MPMELEKPMTDKAKPGVADSIGTFIPGERDMWYFVLFEALIFTAYFIAYMVYRMGDPELFLAGQATLDQNYGAANTLILLTSSLFMAMAVNAVRGGNLSSGRRNIVITLAFGALFIVSKGFEYAAKMKVGIVLSTNLFYSFYYFLTAIHVLHVLIGFVILTIVWLQLRNASQQNLEQVQTGATYWHMVDFLWVFIFALLYVMR